MLLIFLFGIGADENLVSTWQTFIPGRLVYYTGVPLLIGLFFEIAIPKDRPADGAPVDAARLDFPQTLKFVSEHLKDLRTQLSTLGTIATLAAPGIYAYLTHEPLLMNYFDLIQTLLRISTRN